MDWHAANTYKTEHNDNKRTARSVHHILSLNIWSEVLFANVSGGSQAAEKLKRLFQQPARALTDTDRWVGSHRRAILPCNQ